ncbi:MAG: acetylxylan esterase [Lentisphaeria bacterium]|nr:acetylxylan esterase [Lentisphaeria bacterium]
MRKFFITIALVLVLFASAFAHDGINKECNLAIRVTPEKADPEYEKGETIKLKILVYPVDKNKVTDKYTLRVVESKDFDKSIEKNYPITLDKEFVYTTRMDRDGFVRFEVFVQNKDGKNIDFTFGGFKRQKAYDGGAGVGLDNLKQAVEEPTDFDEFWAKQKKMLADTPIKYTIKDAPIKHEKLDVYYVEVECPNSRPATGILTVPKDKSKKYPAMGLYDGYSNTYIQKEPANVLPDDKIVFHLNAHGYNMGEDENYYNEVKKSLKGYAFKNDENANPETAYFYGMALRCMRSLQFLKQHPLYDGVNLEVQGGSQGGLQTIWCAALDHDVKIARPDIPWCADLGGYTKGRLRGWRPDYQKGLDYYDIVNHAKRIPETCFVHITRAGLGDYVCPPSGITIVYNNLKCPKKITYVHDSDHGYINQGSLRFEKESK